MNHLSVLWGLLPLPVECVKLLVILMVKLLELKEEEQTPGHFGSASVSLTEKKCFPLNNHSNAILKFCLVCVYSQQMLVIIWI